MKRHLFITLGFFFLLACNNIDYKPKYKDFANAWEQENLIGKVKYIEQYKANVINFETEKTENPVIEYKKEFTEIGNVSYQEDFDSFGELVQYVKNNYNKRGDKIGSKSENLIIPMRSSEKAVFDTVTGKQISVHAIYNDSLKFDAFFKYDEYDNIIESTSIQENDTTSDRLEYKYTASGNILLKKQIQEADFEIYEYFNEFKYNTDGTLSELKHYSDFTGEKKSIYEYDGEKRIVKIAEFNSGEIVKETFFDIYYNQTLLKFYNKASLNKEMKYEYDFDSKGNWIERKVILKEYFGNDKRWLLVAVKTRNINYFE